VRDPEAVLIALTDETSPLRATEPSPLLALVPTRSKNLTELGDKLSTRAAWVLAHVDGQSNVGTIIARSALPEEEVLELLRELTLLDAIATR
jgi:hypothetical protein